MDGFTEDSKYKRDTAYRIFVVRSLQMEKIKFFGFDMDYTLAVYKSPRNESESFEIIKERLIEIGYPEEIRRYTYDESFPIRGLWFDMEYGTLLKMDQFGNILMATHGFHILTPAETRTLYPNMFMKFDETRFNVLNTLFNLPETYMLACLVDYFVKHPEYTISVTGAKRGTLMMTFKAVYYDLRDTVDYMHNSGILKKRVLSDLKNFVERDHRLVTLLTKLRNHGAKTFLLTNSDYDYTNKIMEYILDFPDDSGEKKKWVSYFDYVVVNAGKPRFFKEGTTLRSLDNQTGRLNIGHHVGPLEPEQIYSGGSCEIFSELIGARGKDVLYVGDHIFGDILKSKKTVGWRTFLVIPELADEIYVWTQKKVLFDELQKLNRELAMAYKDLTISSKDRPNLERTEKAIREKAHEMEQSYGLLGSLFRNGSRQTFFSSQVTRYADIYSYSCLNLLYYPLYYMFRAPPMLMPHESTVSHDVALQQGVSNDEFELDPLYKGSFNRRRSQNSVISIPEKNGNDYWLGVQMTPQPTARRSTEAEEATVAPLD